MKPHDELAAGSTQWVLADPGKAYIAYTYEYDGPTGVKDLPLGSYQLLWLDTVDGSEIVQAVRAASTRDVTWKKPESMGARKSLCPLSRILYPGKLRMLLFVAAS